MSSGNTIGLVKRIVREHIAPYTKTIIIAMACMFLAAAMTGAFAKMIQPVVDKVLKPGHDAIVLPIIVGIMICFILRGLGTYYSTLKMIEVGQGIVADVQSRLFGKLLDMDLAFFHAWPSGGLQSRVLNDVNVMRSAVAETLMGLGRYSITLVILIGVMFWQDWRLSLVSIVLLPVIVFSVGRIGKRLRKVSKVNQDEQAKLASHLTQVFQGIRQVKSFVAEDMERTRTTKGFHRVRDLNIKATSLSNLSLPISDLLIGFTIVGLLMYGAWAVEIGRLTAGGLMSFITAFLLSYEPIKKLARMNASLQVGLGAAERIFDLIDAPPRIVSPLHPEVLPPAPYGIAFENVAFKYDTADEPALRGLSFAIQPGETIALVGPSGGGKSTVLNLIPRFYDPDAGRVTINGVDLKTIDLNEWRRHVALVSQDVVLFNDTVAANIAYGVPEADMASIEAAAKAANAYGFISDMPQGFDTQLGENGVRLSGGQRQRIALARAILKDAPVLLLDEATSALDTESETLIQRALDQFARGRTVVIIAHRLSTVQNADRILVVREGQIIEEGSHDVLMSLGRVYAQLYQGNVL